MTTCRQNVAMSTIFVALAEKTIKKVKFVWCSVFNLMFMQIYILQGCGLAICETNNNELVSSTTLQWGIACLQKLH